MESTRRHWRPLLLAAATVIAAMVGATLAAGLRPESSHPVDHGPPTRVRAEPAPPLSGTTLSGAHFDLTSLRGKVILVNMWASWCAPCRQELALLADAERRWGDRGLVVVGVNIHDGAGAARSTLAELGLRGMPALADPRGTAAVSWGVVGVPETFVVDRSGQLRLSARGTVDTAWLEQRLPPLLDA